MKSISSGKTEQYVGMEQDGVFVVPEKPSATPSGSRAVSVVRVSQTRSDSEASSHMEVDEPSGCTEKGGNTDIDSGIENMEVFIT